MNIDETQIIGGLKNGEEDAYEYIFNHHYAMLCHIASLYVKDDYISETIVSDVIYHIWEIRKKLIISTSLKQFLVRSVRNKCLDYLKQQYVNKEIRMSVTGEHSDVVMETMIESSDYPLGRLFELELEDALQKAIDELPSDCWRVFIMSRINGMKREEIAYQLNISINTVKYHLKQALVLLNEKLGKYLIFLLFIYPFD